QLFRLVEPFSQLLSARKRAMRLWMGPTLGAAQSSARTQLELKFAAVAVRRFRQRAKQLDRTRIMDLCLDHRVMRGRPFTGKLQIFDCPTFIVGAVVMVS